MVDASWSESTYFAHSTGRPDRADWQLLCEHLHQVADLAREHAAKFGAGEWGYAAGLLHDLGKYDPDLPGLAASPRAGPWIETRPGAVPHPAAIVAPREGVE